MLPKNFNSFISYIPEILRSKKYNKMWRKTGDYQHCNTLLLSYCIRNLNCNKRPLRRVDIV